MDKVTPTDRAKSAEWYRSLGFDRRAEQVLNGEDNDPLTQLFARYRVEVQQQERDKITKWLRSLDREGGEINRFLPTTLANWIDEGMHNL